MSVPKDKIKFALYLYPETLERVRELYRQDDCISRSEFIEKAVRFYVGYLTAEDPAVEAELQAYQDYNKEKDRLEKELKNMKAEFVKL